MRSPIRREAKRRCDVLVVGQGAPAQGGIPRFLDAILSSQLARRRDMELVNLTRGPVFDPGRMTAANVRRTLLDAATVWRRARAARLAHVQSAAVPLVTLVRTGLLCGAARLAGARVLLHVHSGLVELWLRTPARRMAARCLLGAASRVAAASEGSRAALAGALGAHKVVLVDNGVDVAAFRSHRTAKDRPVILYAGMLTARKGITDLLDASNELHGRGLEHDLVVAGAPIPESGGLTLEDLRQRSGPATRFLGHVEAETMLRLYADADVFCLPSWWEAMPMSVLEAMAAGLPVVATVVGDLPRAVDDGVSGILVPRSRPDLLAEALRRLLRDPDLCRRMGTEGRRRAEERFSLAGTVSAIDGLYAELLG